MKFRLLAPICKALVLFGLLGCGGRKPEPSEAALFAQVGGSAVWVIDAVTEWPNGNDQHISALITQDRVSGMDYAGCYLSVWQRQPPGHASSLRVGPGNVGGRRDRWPITLRMPSDSSQAAFSWDWNHRSFWMQGALPPEDDSQLRLWSWRGHYPDQQTFQTVELCNSPEIWTVAPWSGSSRVSDRAGSGRTRWRCGVFREADAFFGGGAGEAFVWLSAGFADGRSLQAYLHVNAQGEARLLGQQLWEGRVPQAATVLPMPFQTSPSTIWHSPMSGRAYPLEWRLDAGARCCLGEGQNAALLVRPCLQDQEIAMKRSSFWMGAIEVADVASSAIVGKGNMFVLVR